MPTPTPIRRRLLRTKQAAEYLSCSAWTLRRLTQEGRIPVVQATPDSPFTFDIRDLDRFIEQNKHSSPWDTASL